MPKKELLLRSRQVRVGLMQDSFDGIDLTKPISHKTKQGGPETSFAVCSKS
jgi:hypothetical protein